MAKVADPVVLEGLEDALLQPAMLDEITAAVTAEVSKALNTQPGRTQSPREAPGDRGEEADQPRVGHRERDRHACRERTDGQTGG